MALECLSVYVYGSTLIPYFKDNYKIMYKDVLKSYFSGSKTLSSSANCIYYNLNYNTQLSSHC